MAERNTKVTLSANVQGYVDAMGKAADKTREVGSESEKLAQKREAFALLGKTAFAAGGLIAAGLGLAVAKFAEFDQAMSYVAATGEDARDSIDALRDAAIDAGARTVFSATEAANAIEEMAKAGLSAEQILGGGLDGALDLAAAGGLAVADAAGIAATALKTFNLEGSDMAHVADLLAAGAGKAMGDVSDLSQALNQSAMVANATGLSIEETTATLSAFASQGLLGSDAGTSFKSMLQRLTPQSKEAQKAMSELGIAAYDASGEFIGMEKFAGNLQGALKDLTPEQRNSAMATIFGTDAVRAANVLYTEGEAGIRDWIAAVDDQGYAARTAAERLDNLAGDVEALGGAFDSALISMGSAADGPLRFIIQELTELVDMFNAMPEGAQQAVFWVGMVGGAALLAYGSWLLLVPKVVAYNDALKEMGPTAQKAARALKAVGTGVAIGAAVVVGITALEGWLKTVDGIEGRAQSAVSAARDLKAALEQTLDYDVTGMLDADTFNALIKRQDNGWTHLSAIWDTAMQDAIDLESGLNELGKPLAELARNNMPAATAQFQKYAEATDGSKEQTLALLKSLGPEFMDVLRQASLASGGLASDQELLDLAMGKGSAGAEKQAKKLEELQGVAQDTSTDVATLADQIRDFGSAAFDTERASISFEQALDDLDEQLKEGKGSLDKNTQSGRDTTSAMLDAAQSANDFAASIAGVGGSTEDVQAILDVGRQKIVDTRMALGDSEEAAKAYADQLILTPATITTAIELAGIDPAQVKIDAFRRSLDRLQGVSVNIGVNDRPLILAPGKAAGGPISGPGTGTSDSVPIMASAGEHMWTAEEVRAAGGHAAVYALRESVKQGRFQYSQGGPIGRYSDSPATSSLDGMTIQGTLDLGNGLSGFVDGRIVKASAADAYRSDVALSGGRVSP